MTEYRRLRAAEDLADEIIEEHYPFLDERIRVMVIMTDKTPKKDGREVPGKASLISGRAAYLAGPKSESWSSGIPFFLLEIAQPAWNGYSEDNRAALLDHLLGHCQRDPDTEAWIVKAPEFGEFEDVLERRGFWRKDAAKRLKRFARAASDQLALLPDEEEEWESDQLSLAAAGAAPDSSETDE